MNCPHCRGQLAVTKPFCDFCREPFQHGQQVQVTPPISFVEIGQKSGRPILVPDQTNQTWDLVHLGCAKAYHDPEVNGGYEELRAMIRDDVIAEEVENLKEQVYAELAEESGIVCGDCLDEVDITNMSQDERLELWQRAYRTIQQLQPYFPPQS